MIKQKQAVKPAATNMAPEKTLQERLLQIRSPAKRRLAEFLYVTNSDEKTTFTFVLTNTNYDNACRFVHSMRVNLSKIRNKKLAAGEKLRPFKMIVISISPYETGMQITLERTTARKIQMQNAAKDLLGSLV